MGRPMTESEAQEFKNLVGWENDDWMDFRTWCGVCALCERILGNCRVIYELLTLLTKSYTYTRFTVIKKYTSL